MNRTSGKSLLSSLDSRTLPYTPTYFQEGRVLCMGHPDLVPALRKWTPVSRHSPMEGAVIHKERPNLILETDLSQSEEFPWQRQMVKQFKWRGLSLLWSPFRQSKALRSYLVACHLLRHGLLTPMPLGAVECRRLGFVRYNMYVTEVLRDFMDLKKYRKHQPHGREGMEQVIRMLADYVLRMHDSGLLHRDLNLTNFLFTNRAGEYSLYLVDLNRARFERNLNMQHRARDLSRLDLEQWQELFFKSYCKNRFDAEKMLEMASMRKTRRRSWRQAIKWTNPMRKKLGLK